MKRFTVRELPDAAFGNPGQLTRVFDASRPGDSANVWASAVVDGKSWLACTSCSGPMSAMLSSCRHCNAVKRHIANSTKE